MTLSTNTIHNLAQVLTPDVVKFIISDERYTDFMFQMIPEAIRASMGDIDDNVAGEISCCIMDSISLAHRN